MISFFDAVVLGDELAGAVAAALLARRGYRVLVLARAPQPEDTIGAHAFPRAPLSIAGLESPVWKRLTSELNLVQSLRRRVSANHPAWQLLLPDHRIDVGEELPRELMRELPDEVSRFDAWTAAAARVGTILDRVLASQVMLPPDGFWDRRDLKRVSVQMPPDEHELLDLLPPGRPLRLFASLPARFASDLDTPGAVSHARLGELYRQGTWSVQGGREGMRALLYERVRAAAGEVRHDLRVRGLVVRRGRVVGVAVGDKDQTIGCELVVAAEPAARVVELLPEEAPRRLREAAAVRPASHRYRLHMIAPVSALPDPLGRIAFAVRDPALPLEGANALSIHVTEAHGRDAVITVEALARDITAEGLLALRVEVRREVDRLLPFLGRHLVAAWSPHESAGAEGLGTAAPPPVAPDAVWALPAAPALGVCGVHYATGMKGLYLASRQVLPGLGVEGELCAGWCVTQLAVRKHRKKDGDKGRLLADG